MSQQFDARKANPQKADGVLVSGLLQRSRTIPLSAEHDQLTPSLVGSATHPFTEPNFKHDFSLVPVRSTTAASIQTMPMIGQPSDRHEQEAERVAHKVVNSKIENDQEKPPPIPTRPVKARLISSNEDEEKKKKIAQEQAQKAEQKKHQAEKEKVTAETKVVEADRKKKEEGKVQTSVQPGQTPTITPVLQKRLNASQGGGYPLPEPTRGFMESHFKHDFSKVRVHSDPQATQSLKARAFTYRHNIFFNATQYQPETPVGQHLLAHELTHVVQQGAVPMKLGKETKLNRHEQ